MTAQFTAPTPSRIRDASSERSRWIRWFSDLSVEDVQVALVRTKRRIAETEQRVAASSPAP